VAVPAYVLLTPDTLLGPEQEKINSFIELLPTWKRTVFWFLRVPVIDASKEMNQCLQF
jgi:hypothetical protein